MRWSLEYSVGIKQVDEEHKMLFKLISDIGKAMNGKVTQIEILKSMVEYSKKHFASEEKLMKKIYYPRLDYHIQLHRYFENEIIKYLNQVKKGEELDLPQIKEFLEKWLVNHILKEDKKIGEFRYSK